MPKRKKKSESVYSRYFFMELFYHTFEVFCSRFPLCGNNGWLDRHPQLDWGSIAQDSHFRENDDIKCIDKLLVSVCVVNFDEIFDVGVEYIDILIAHHLKISHDTVGEPSFDTGDHDRVGVI